MAEQGLIAEAERGGDAEAERGGGEGTWRPRRRRPRTRGGGARQRRDTCPRARRRRGATPPHPGAANTHTASPCGRACSKRRGAWSIVERVGLNAARGTGQCSAGRAQRRCIATRDASTGQCGVR
eukprot:3364642-Rhodomonas_salina.1